VDDEDAQGIKITTGEDTTMTMKTAIKSAALALAGVFVVWGLVGMAQSEEAKQNSFDEKEVEALETVIFDYLMENPEVIIQAVDKLQERQDAEAAARAAQAMMDHGEMIYGSPAEYVAGNPEGDVTIVEFFDYHCSYCKRGLANLLAAIEEDPNLRVVFKEFPILNEQSEVAARAALAAGAQGKYLELHTAMMRFDGRLTNDRIDQLAKDVGLNVKKLHKAMEDPKIDEIITTNKYLAETLGISGTPSFVIADQLYAGMLEKAQIKTIVAMARKRDAEQAAVAE